MIAKMVISSYVLILVTCSDLCDGLDLGFVHARRLQIPQRLQQGGKLLHNGTRHDYFVLLQRAFSSQCELSKAKLRL